MANFADLTIWTGDNLDITRGLNPASVYLIYLDPPFSSNRRYVEGGLEILVRRPINLTGKPWLGTVMAPASAT